MTPEQAAVWVLKLQADSDEEASRALVALIDAEVSAVSAQAKVLYSDVDDMMNVLRLVASTEYTRGEVRQQAARALERLKTRGVGA